MLLWSTQASSVDLRWRAAVISPLDRAAATTRIWRDYFVLADVVGRSDLLILYNLVAHALYDLGCGFNRTQLKLDPLVLQLDIALLDLVGRHNLI